MALADGTYTLVPASATGCAMDVVSGFDENAVNVQIYTRIIASDASKNDAQIVQVITYNGVQIIRFPLTGRVLDINGNNSSPVAGDNIMQYVSSGSAYQEWKIVDTGATASIVGNYTTAASNFELYTIESNWNTSFSVKSGTASGTALTLAATDTTASTQRWAFLPLHTVTDGTYFIACVNDPSVVCDVAYKSTANGSRVFIDSNNGGNNQIWNFSNNTDGTVSITDTNSGKLLSCGLGGVSGTEVYVWADENHDDQHWGIIPAYAGSTVSHTFGWSAARDHPRIRGEHVEQVFQQVRGLGIIPAYAGSTKLTVEPKADGGDHPRIRGEHCGWLSRTAYRSGSSPHTRGARCSSYRD